MRLFSSIKTCFKKYYVFSGRAPRSEFIYFSTFVLLGYLVFYILDVIILMGPNYDSRRHHILSEVFSLGIFLPQIATSVRRLHDLNLRGYWLLLLFLPTIIHSSLAFFLVYAADFYPLNGQEDLQALKPAFGLFAKLVVYVMPIAICITLIMLICLIFIPGKKARNRYGDNPLYSDLP